MVTVREVLTNLKGLLDKYYLRGDGSNLKNSNNSIVKNGIVCTDESTGKIIPKSQLSTDKIADLTSYIQGTSINGDKIVDNTISSDKLKNGSVTNEKLKPIEILETDELDLDKYKTQGFYYCPSNYTVGKMSHTPWQVNPPTSGNGVGSAFSLVVLKTTGTYVRQLLFNYQNNDVQVFSRNFSGSWTPTTSGVNGWIKLSVDGHTHNYIPNTTGSVTSDHIKDKTIVNGDIADTTIESGKIKENAITEGKISNGAVTTDKINNSAVTEVKINSNAVTSDKIKNSAVTTDKISNGAVTLVKLNSSDVIDTTVGGTNSSGKLITSNAVKNHTHGNINNDGTLSQNNESATYNINNLPIVADSTSNYKLKKGVVSTTSIGSGAISSLGINQGDTQATVNNKVAEKLSHGWKNVTVDSSKNLVSSYELNGVTYRQFINGSGVSIIYLRGELTTNTQGTSNQASIGFINENYPPFDVDYPLFIIGSDGKLEYKYSYPYSILHPNGTVLSRIEYNTIENKERWRVMIINNSGTARPRINGQIMYNYKW